MISYSVSLSLAGAQDAVFNTNNDGTDTKSIQRGAFITQLETPSNPAKDLAIAQSVTWPICDDGAGSYCPVDLRAPNTRTFLSIPILTGEEPEGMTPAIGYDRQLYVDTTKRFNFVG